MATFLDAKTTLPLLAVSLAFALLAPGCSGGSEEGQGPGAGAGDDGGVGFFALGDGSVRPASCATVSAAASMEPLDVFVALDKSGSMLADGRWPSVTTALKAFVSNQKLTGLSIALKYFPDRRLCAPDAYEVPEVGLVALPGGAATVVASLEAQAPNGGTPMAPALEGTLRAARAWADTHPNHRVVVLLATDGVPDANCVGGGEAAPNDVDGVVAIAAAGATGARPIPTYVIGVGAALGDLNRVAAAGGTGSAILIDGAKNVQESFITALGEVRKKSLSCRYAIPAAGGTVDPEKVNVSLTLAGRTTVPAYVDGEARCSPEAGWHYDRPTDPTSVVLCPSTCAEVTRDDDAKVEVVFGCRRGELR